MKLLTCHEASCCPGLAAFRLRVPLHHQKWLERFLPGQALQTCRVGASGMKFKRNPRLARISLLDRSWSVSSPALGRGIIIIEIGDTSKRVLNYRHDFKLFKFKLLEVHDTFCQPRQRSWGSPATADNLQKVTLDLGSSPVLLDSTKLLRWMPVLQNGELDWCQTWLFPFLPTYILSALLWRGNDMLQYDL